MTMENIEKSVIAWSEKRGLIDETTHEKQCIKLMEEVGELARAILHEDRLNTIIEIGDCLVVLTNICAKIDIHGGLETCFLAAYNKIEHRKGRMVNGTFIKDLGPS